jgi:hypothetical protein
LTKFRSALVLLLALAGMLLVTGSASAKDRNHDRIPDRWEKRHHLSLHHNQARRDQDRDGLRNRAEFRAGTNPRDDDSDGDGLEDGDENAGTVVSFEGGILKITVFGQSDPLVGTVDDSTEIECEHAMATKSDDGPGESGDDEGDDHGDDQGGDEGDDQGGDEGDHHGDDESDGDNGDGEHGDQEDDDHFDEQSCGTDQLTPGMKVKEAELRLVGGKAVFQKLELHP